MKTLITLLSLVFCIQTTKAQTYVNIPDANFVAWLQTNIPSAMNGNQMDITNAAVTTQTRVNVPGLSISDLTGIEYFTSLTSLSCYSNSLTSIPTLPNTLINLECSDNQLTSLPILPNSLSLLDCGINQLTAMPVLPNSLQYLACSGNQLLQLPTLPANLSELRCADNQLTSLPDLPLGLRILNCQHNNIACFPAFPNTLQRYVETVNGPMVVFGISFNPFTCLPNYVSAMDSTTLSYPLCALNDTIHNPNGCAAYKNISGFVFRDNNYDCIKSYVAEFGISAIPVKIYDMTNSFIGSTSSALLTGYNVSLPAATYHLKIDTLNKPYVTQCSYPGADTLLTVNTTTIAIDSVNFPVVCKQGFDVGVQSIVTNSFVIPGQIHQLDVNAGDITRLYYLHCSNGVSGTVSFSVNGPVTYVAPGVGALTPTVTGNVFSYNIPDFGTTNTNSFRLIFLTDTTAQAGDMICVNATVTPTSGDNNISNNTYSYCYPVMNSLDPNYKEVYPIEVHPGFNDWLTYTIHFQNIGGGQAMNIKVADVLDSKLNTETFEIVDFSNANSIELVGNNLLIDFPNINLAPNAFGFVQYRIKPKTSWMNDTIRNSAKIYFDYNSPIVTNTTKNYFVTTMGINDIGYLNEVVGISPNPVNDVLHITSRFSFEKVELLSITGQVLLQENANSNNVSLSTNNLTSGIYFVRVVYPKGLNVTKKVIKQ